MNRPDAVNSAKINRQVYDIRRLRLAPNKTLPVGWADCHISPVSASELEKAGLAFITVRLEDGYRTVTAKE